MVRFTFWKVPTGGGVEGGRGVEGGGADSGSVHPQLLAMG